MSYHQLSSGDRSCIGICLRKRFKPSDIAKELGVHRSTITRELKRNIDPSTGKYHARIANTLTLEKRNIANQQHCVIKNNEYLQRQIEEKLVKENWSPEQIAGRWRTEKKETLCHETIYQYIYRERPDLRKSLPRKSNKYRKKRGSKQRGKEREYAKKRWIDDRPKIIEERARYGDWEGDTIVGKERKQRILTHVERKSGYLLADKLERGLSINVRYATAKAFKEIPRSKKYTITYDNGTEFSSHEMIERDTNMTIFFAHIYHSWERGTNENTNGLIRRYLPKGSKFANLKHETLKQIVDKINHRPRKRLNYRTPYEVFHRVALQNRI